MNERKKIIEDLKITNKISRKKEKKLLGCGVNKFWIKVSSDFKLSEAFIEKYLEKISLDRVLLNQSLSEEFIEKYKDIWDWYYVSCGQVLSEAFIERHTEDVDWWQISENQHLSEKFILKFKNKVNWFSIFYSQNISEDIIEKYAKEMHWDYISEYQPMSESFIEKHLEKINMMHISKSQVLSESFIDKYKDYLEWYYISTYQNLSESFIEKHSQYVVWPQIVAHQKLSKDFIERMHFEIDESNWLYRDTAFKKQIILKTKLYECYDDYFEAYLLVRNGCYPLYNFFHKYLPGETYKCRADYSDVEKSYGFTIASKKNANKFPNETFIKVKVNYSDVAHVVCKGNEIRCSKLTVLD